MLKTTHAPAAAGGHDMGGAAAKAEAPAGAAADVNVSFGDMWIKSDISSVKAGKVTFGVKNEGATMHGLAIIKAPASVSDGMVDESTFLTKGADLDGGAADTVTADLAPGKYELLCFMPGHYAAGQTMPFAVEVVLDRCRNPPSSEKRRTSRSSSLRATRASEPRCGSCSRASLESSRLPRPLISPT